MVTVVVTGASGFLGRAVVKKLRQRPHVKVHPVSRQSLPDGVRVRHYSEAPRADVLIHMAEEADRAKVATLGNEYAGDAAATIAALLDGRYQRLIYASSAVLYGDRSTRPHTPDDAVYLEDPYTRLKRASELAVLGSTAGVVARVANVYGPAMSPSTVMSTILSQIPGSGAIRVMDTTPVRDFVWIDDAAEAFAALATAAGPCGIFNVGSGVGTSIGTLARAALDVAGESHRDVTATDPPRPSTIVVDSARTAQAYGWQPHTRLREGLSMLMSGAPYAEARRLT